MNSHRWTIQVWQHRDAPVEWRHFSKEGDWVALVPPTFAIIPVPWLEGWKPYAQIGNWVVYVGPPRGTETVPS